MKKKLLFLSMAAALSLCACSGNESKQNESANDLFNKWKRCYYVDDFGKPSSETYEKVLLRGTFSNSATTNSRLLVAIVAERDSTIRIKLWEYESMLAKNFLGSVKVRKADGAIATGQLYFSKDGDAFIYQWSSWDKDIRNALLSSGEKDVLIVEQLKHSGVPSTYKFTIPENVSIIKAINRLNE